MHLDPRSLCPLLSAEFVEPHHKITLGAKENFVLEHWPVTPMTGQQKVRGLSELKLM
jgi:hypothetical protein